MWHWENQTRSDEYMPAPIAPELVREGIFMFLGKRCEADALDYELILEDFDRLLPLYCYVESGGKSQPVLMPTECCSRLYRDAQLRHIRQLPPAMITSSTSFLRHNVLQQALHQRLVSQFGDENVGTELASGVGTSVDLVVRRSEGYWFYEIKTVHSPRACIREAMGQLLEYSFWPGSQEIRIGWLSSGNRNLTTTRKNTCVASERNSRCRLTMSKSPPDSYVERGALASP